MNYGTAALAGFLQGLTEFLPVSSSGHLALARSIPGYESPGTLFEVFVHLGTALSIAAVFPRDLLSLCRGGLRFFTPGQWKGAWAEDPAGFRTSVLVVVSAIPIAIVGFMFQDAVVGVFDAPRMVGALLVATGLILFVARFAPPRSLPVGFRVATAMGFAQAFAILPGISRSGATIVAGLLAGGDRAGVGRFAFLMAVPPILGAALLLVVRENTDGRDWGPIAVGTLVAFVSGTIALRLLLRFVRSGKLWVFTPYCVAIGVYAMVSG